MIKSLIDTYRKYSTFKTTYKELSRLSNKELYDLGIHRSEIVNVAYQTTYGRDISHA